MKPCVDCQGKAITQEQVAKEWNEGVCDVCRILKKDTTMKQVKHCDFCNADLCAACENRLGARMAAAVIEAFNFKTKGK